MSISAQRLAALAGISIPQAVKIFGFAPAFAKSSEVFLSNKITRLKNFAWSKRQAAGNPGSEKRAGLVPVSGCAAEDHGLVQRTRDAFADAGASDLGSLPSGAYAVAANDRQAL